MHIDASEPTVGWWVDAPLARLFSRFGFVHHGRSRAGSLDFNDNHVICAIFYDNLKGYYDLEGLDFYLGNNHVHFGVIIHNTAVI